MARTGTGGGLVTSVPAGIDCGIICSAPFSPGIAVTLTAYPDATSTFIGWSGACSGTGACTVAMDSAKSVVAAFTKVSHTLNVTRTGTGGGLVTSVPAGIACGVDCSAAFDAGTVVTLTASPETTSTFTGWSGACFGTGACTVTMDAARSVTATFTKNTYTLTVSRTGSGAGAVTSSPAGVECGVDCSVTFDAETMVSLTATPDSSSTFGGWSGACFGSGACTVMMDAAKSVTATFIRDTYTLSVTTTGNGSGTVTSSPVGIFCGTTCADTFDAETTVALTASPDGSSTFTGWSGACSGSGACSVTMDAAKSVTATFTRATYVLTVTREGTGAGLVTSAPAGITCGVDCSATFDAGTVVSLTASSDASSTFAGWSGACSGSGACTVSLDAAKSVTATFTRSTYVLTVAKSGSGSGTVTSAAAGINCGTQCSAAFDAGAVVSLSATADDLSTFTGWSGGCTGTGSCSVTMDLGTSVTATFTRLTPTEQLAALDTQIGAMGLPDGTTASLQAKVRSALTSAAPASCNQLEALLKEVRAQAGKKLTAQQASDLIAAVTRIRSEMGCS